MIICWFVEVFGVMFMVLYKYVVGCDDLIDGMVDVIIMLILELLDFGGDWWGWVWVCIFVVCFVILGYFWVIGVIELCMNVSLIVLGYMDLFMGMFWVGGFLLDFLYNFMYVLSIWMWGFICEVFFIFDVFVDFE